MIRRTLALAGLIGVFACSAAGAAPVTVDLRVEGSTETFFEGPVTTDGHQIDGHPCDGTNGGVNPTPGPTMFSALDDSGLNWGRTWDDGFQDFFLNSIGPESNASDFSTFWSYFLNGKDPGKGGCQQQVAAGQQVLFAYGPFGTPLLRLSAAPRAAVGEAVAVLVEEVDGSTGTAVPSQGASVAGTTTGVDGRAAPVFTEPGSYTFKATKADTIRSNSSTVCVYAPGSGGCGLDAPADDVAPDASISGLVNGRTYRRAPRTLRGHVDEAGGIHQVYLRVRMIDRRGCRWLSGRREVFSRPRTCDRARFIRLGDSADWSYLLPLRLPAGARYIVDVKALDRSLNRDLEQVRFRVAG
jgi:hypothetical protein